MIPYLVVLFALAVSGSASRAHAFGGGKPLQDDGAVADGSHYPVWFCGAVGTDRHSIYASPGDDAPSSVLIEYSSANLYTTCGSAALSAIRDCRKHDSKADTCRMSQCTAYACNVHAGEQCANPVQTVQSCS